MCIRRKKRQKQSKILQKFSINCKYFDTDNIFYWIYFCSRYYILRTVFRWPEAIRNIWVKGWSHLVFGEKIQQRTSKISRYWDAQLFNLYEMLHRNLVCPCNLLLSRSEITTFWTNIATKYFYDFMLQFFLSVHTCNKACVS